MIRLTIGTSIRPASIQKAPQLIGDCSIGGKYWRRKIFSIITIEENRKLVQQAAFVVFFQYSPYRKGARKAPARAPQEMPIS